MPDSPALRQNNINPAGWFTASADQQMLRTRILSSAESLSIGQRSFAARCPEWPGGLLKAGLDTHDEQNELLSVVLT
jgi:hypothetical protein